MLISVVQCPAVRHSPRMTLCAIDAAAGDVRRMRAGAHRRRRIPVPAVTACAV